VLWCQLLAEMQEYASQPSQPPGDLSAVNVPSHNVVSRSHKIR
jgi:hypothetical protein